MSSTQLMSSLESLVDQNQLSALKLALFALGLPLHQLNKASCLTDLYNIYQVVRPNDSLSILLQLLARLGVPQSELFFVRRYVRARAILENVDGYQLVDLVMNLSYVLSSISEEQYASFESLALRAFFPHGGLPAKPGSFPRSSRTSLVELLVYDNAPTVDNIGQICAILEVVAPTYRWYITRYFHCHNVKEPNWKVFVPVVEKMSLDLKGNYFIEYPSIAVSPLLNGGKKDLLSSSGKVPCSDSFEKKKDLIYYKPSDRKNQFDNNNHKVKFTVVWLTLCIVTILCTSSILCYYYYSNCCLPVGYNTTLQTKFNGSSFSQNLILSFNNQFNSISHLSNCTSASGYSLRKKSMYLQIPSGRNIGMNYYDSNGPVYTDGPGILTFEIMAVLSGNAPNESLLKFHLFNNANFYYEFLMNGNLGGAISTHGFDQLRKAGRKRFLDFVLSSKGFYFVGVSSALTAFLEVQASASLTAFDVSKLMLVENSLTFNFTQTHPSFLLSNKTSNLILSYKMSVDGLESIATFCTRFSVVWFGLIGSVIIVMVAICIIVYCKPSSCSSKDTKAHVI